MEKYGIIKVYLYSINENGFDFLNIFDFSRDYSYADWIHECLEKEIGEFENELDNDHEIAVMLTNLGTSTVMRVENIRYQNPSLVYFYGTINGKPAQLIQHVSQINFVLMAVPRLPDKPAHRIGFLND